MSADEKYELHIRRRLDEGKIEFGLYTEQAGNQYGLEHYITLEPGTPEQRIVGVGVATLVEALKMGMEKESLCGKPVNGASDGLFRSRLWTKEPPRGQMFIWAYRKPEGGWNTGLGYWTVSGSWRDAYDWNGNSHRLATDFHPMPEPPG